MEVCFAWWNVGPVMLWIEALVCRKQSVPGKVHFTEVATGTSPTSKVGWHDPTSFISRARWFIFKVLSYAGTCVELELPTRGACRATHAARYEENFAGLPRATAPCSCPRTHEQKCSLAHHKPFPQHCTWYTAVVPGT